MKRALIGLGTLIAASWSVPAISGGAFCTPDWRPENPNLGCSSHIAISPGNDSRINLFLLLQDRAGSDGSKLAYPDSGWAELYGRNFLRWQMVRAAWYPESEQREWPNNFGTRCQTAESGEKAYLEALNKAFGLRAKDREFLSVSRKKMTDVCDDGLSVLGPLSKGGFFTTPRAFGSLATMEGSFLGYLEASTNFYASRLDRAYDMYRKLARESRDAWVKETALYMSGRTALNKAIDSGATRWGGFNLQVAEAGPALQAERDFRAYLSRYPTGQYADSARGLIRKAQWLRNDFVALGAIYETLLAEADPASRDTADLVEEVDDKFLILEAHEEPEKPLLLAADLLMKMRTWSGQVDSAVLSEAALAGAEEKFAGHDDLFTFLQANHAFYVRGQHREVLALLPDAARAESYTPLDFSRQYLRGLALHALEDRNEEGFWRDLIKGSNGIWQRPAVELALARNLEQTNKLDAVFAEGSPITDRRIRRVLLGQTAGIEILKAQSRAEGQPPSERKFALFTAMLKQLQHGQYAGFLEDYALAETVSTESDKNLWSIYNSDTPPVDFFLTGNWSDGYDCPTLKETVERLQRRRSDVRGRLCLGDFYRLNGFDDFAFGGGYVAPGSAPVLGARDFYEGDPTPRHDFYTSIIAAPRVAADDRAYALYRAVRCYAPTNNNTCGGPGVDKEQRARWFRQLKRSYPSSRWARKLEYYW